MVKKRKPTKEELRWFSRISFYIKSDKNLISQYTNEICGCEDAIAHNRSLIKLQQEDKKTQIKLRSLARKELRESEASLRKYKEKEGIA